MEKGGTVSVVQITGCCEEAGVPHPLPVFIGGIGRVGEDAAIDASLIRISRGAAYYREITVVEGLGRFDRMQK